jgi:hypothetical protein
MMATKTKKVKWTGVGQLPWNPTIKIIRAGLGDTAYGQFRSVGQAVEHLEAKYGPGKLSDPEFVGLAAGWAWTFFADDGERPGVRVEIMYYPPAEQLEGRYDCANVIYRPRCPAPSIEEIVC